MAKKKVKIDTPKVDVSIEKDAKNVKIEVDTPNIDVSVIKDELKKEFHMEGKNIDIDVKKTSDGIDVSVQTNSPLWKILAKRIVKFVLKKFNK